MLLGFFILCIHNLPSILWLCSNIIMRMTRNANVRVCAVKRIKSLILIIIYSSYDIIYDSTENIFNYVEHCKCEYPKVIS